MMKVHFIGVSSVPDDEIVVKIEEFKMADQPAKSHSIWINLPSKHSNLAGM